MIQASSYQQQLDEKIQRLQALLHPFNAPALQVFESPAEHYRMRAEFKIWQTAEAANYAMYTPAPERKAYCINNFPPASKTINELMPQLIDAINREHILRHKLFEVHFLTSTTGEALVSLIYHKPLDTNWQQQAEILRQQLSINIIGRSRGKKIMLGNDFIQEVFEINGQKFYYRHSENSFTQPNGFVCQHMLNWANTQSQKLGGDLLELYCGNGNFTLPLSRNFNKVLANEISKASTADALLNLAQNHIDNVTIVRMSSEDLTDALLQKRPFRRLQDIDLSQYEFSTVFVDPPRAGLDDQTLAFIAQFTNIIYISCNQHSLADNIRQLSCTHSIEALALFDQFPNTEHIESGVLLKKL